jgi:hypothetical protein
MTFDLNLVLPSIISATSGLVGVGLGGFITNRRENLREHFRINTESSYLAILVLAHLDRFVNGCLDVAFDDGTSEGQPAGMDGQCHQTTACAPLFDPLALNVDWKVLPPKLMYDILKLPYRAEQLENYLADEGFFDPPDYTDFFWTRRHGYAVLGLEVSAVASHLREYANLPLEAPIEGKLDRDEQLREQRDKIDNERAEYQDRIAHSHIIPT